MFDGDLFNIFVCLELHDLPLQVLDLCFDLRLDIMAGEVCERHDVDILDSCQEPFGFFHLGRQMLTELLDLDLRLLGVRLGQQVDSEPGVYISFKVDVFLAVAFCLPGTSGGLRLSLDCCLGRDRAKKLSFVDDTRLALPALVRLDFEVKVRCEFGGPIADPAFRP